MKKLKHTNLKFLFNYKDFNYNFNDNKYNIIGQTDAVEKIKFGLNIKNKGYNIYVSGAPGSGRTTFCKKYAKQIARLEKTPDDLIYVYNFKNPKKPNLINLPFGKAVLFKKDLEDFLNKVYVGINKIFTSKDYEQQKDSIIKDFNLKRKILIKKAKDFSRQKGFELKISKNEFYFLPIINNEILFDEQYEKLSINQKDELEEVSENIQNEVSKILKETNKIENDLQTKLKNLDFYFSVFTVGNYISFLQEKYLDNQKIINYLFELKEDILQNIDIFLKNDNKEDENILNILPINENKTKNDLFEKYNINIIVDNSKLDGAPVIYDVNPTYTKLIGELEFDNEIGNLTTDYMKIKPGLFHKSNGGYLILNIKDILNNAYVWETLIKVVKTQKVIIEPIKETQISAVSISYIKPEPLNINVKIILIGSEYEYQLLNEYDLDFLKWFKVHAIFDYEMDNNPKNIQNIIDFINSIYICEKTLPFDNDIIEPIVNYSIRLTENQKKLTTNLSKIKDIFIEANTWALTANSSKITKFYIEKAIFNKTKSIKLYEEKLKQMIIENKILIETNGYRIGQVNGLCVVQLDDYCFGFPSKITATTYIGECGIVNIEKEADISGNIHNKGVQVLTGYLGQIYSQDFPLSFSCRLCFEQNYDGVDGDSASSSELYAILSSLSGVALNQSIAVTGSINQKGEIQPIGGVTYKIEGFFDICKKRGLTGEHGVIIPIQNVKDLCLKDDVINAVKNNLFNIYPIKHISEGMEILTGIEFGQKLKNGKFSKNSINFKVLNKLNEFYEKSKK